MFDCFLAQLLVLTMIFFCSARVFFLKNARIDCFAAFAPAALIVSAFTFYCFGFSVANLAIFLLAVMVAFTNFRAILRLYARLVIDSYNIVFILFSVLNLFVTILFAVTIVMLRPVKYSDKDFGIKMTPLTLTGPSSNLRVRESPFTGERFSGEAFLYEPIVHDEITEELYSENPVLLFVSGIRGNVKNYEPYFMILAQKGYKVLAADLYTDDFRLLSKETESKVGRYFLDSKFLRRFAILHLENINPQKAEKLLAEEKLQASKKYSALTKFAIDFLGDETKFFYIVDNVDFDSIYAVIDEFNTEPYSNAKGFFSMNRVDEYKTSGYGFIEQTDVLLAKQKEIERDPKFFIPRYMANKTVKTITEKK
ncbi:MAG: hypothetical protein IJJ71_12050 [Treponema sp.]|uniref:hypothetical protein n=1 Tax=Treponema sp. TaxID=166 RepID=UPI0025EDF166|nr:hypothetical protein [Treponema sp.]MBR0496895.1 hypothetical protein [Treponema sp.]